MRIPALALALAAALSAPAVAWAQEPEGNRQDPPQQPPEPGSWRDRYTKDAEFDDYFPFIATRAGTWISAAFEMESVTGHGPRSISGNTLWNAGIDFGAVIDNRWAFWASYDAGLSNDVTMSVLGGNIGFTFKLESLGLLGNWPITAMLSVGASFGDVNVHNFANFDYGFGYRGGLNLLWSLDEKVGIEACFDARFIEFDIDDDVFAGDTAYGGGSFAFGIGFAFKL
jgi:hypothetical protein